jgi:hypothetical protein
MALYRAVENGFNRLLHASNSLSLACDCQGRLYGLMDHRPWTACWSLNCHARESVRFTLAEAIYFLGSAFWESASYFPLRFCAFILLGLSSTDQMRFEQSEIQARINTAI